MKDFRADFWINSIWKEYVFAFPTAKVCCLFSLLWYFSRFSQSKFLQEGLTFVSGVDFFLCVCLVCSF